MNIKILISLILCAGFSLSQSGHCASTTYDSDTSQQNEYTQITNLPTIYINTEGGVAITSKEEYVNAVVTVRGADNNNDNITEVAAEIKGRGNSTWGMDKKPYRLKFKEKIKFLGNEAKEKNWVLLANYADKTLMRNALAFETTRQFFNFQFTPSVTFVDVVLNGENLGNYMLTDQVEVKSKRVSVTEQVVTDTRTPEITGGYLIEVDGFAEKEISWFKTSHDMKITIKYPKDDEINKSQTNYISNYTQRMENALFADSFTDKERGWRRYIDEESWVDWYIACELFGNSDSWWSTYMYKERGEKFRFGPLWDFDIAFNNDYRIGSASCKFMRDAGCEPKTWIKRWWQDSTLVEAVKMRWRELNVDSLRAFMTNYIDATAQYLDESQKINYETWPTLDVRVHYEFEVRGSYEAEVNYLKRYVNARIDFLDSKWGAPAGIEETITNNSITIAPNPVAHGNDVIIKDIHAYGLVNIILTSVDGRVMRSWQERVANDNTLTLSSNGLLQGIYMIIISDADRNIYRGNLVIK